MKRKDISLKVLMLSIDIALLFAAIFISVFIRLGYFLNVIHIFTGATLAVVFSYLCSFYIFDLYSLDYRVKSRDFLTRYVAAILAGTALSALVYYFAPHYKYGRGILVLNGANIAILMLLSRVIFQKVFSLEKKRERILIAGAGVAARTICEVLDGDDSFGIVGIVDDDPSKKGIQIEGYEVDGDCNRIYDLVQKRNIDSIVVAITHEKKAGLLKTLLNAKYKGTQVYDMQTLYEKVTGKIPVTHVEEGWLVYTPFYGVQNSLYTIKIKRLMDIAISLFGLLILSPIFLLIALIIKMDSKGTVFYTQKRVGLNGHAYTMFKFRSMVEDAESGEPLWAAKDDLRITRIGRAIRKFRLDELPQLWNVLRGYMSLVGPRPERPEFVKELEKEIPFYSMRYSVKPGITGWAQVKYAYGASSEDALEKLQYDLFYVKNLDIMLDLQILTRTIWTVVSGKGAR